MESLLTFRHQIYVSCSEVLQQELAVKDQIPLVASRHDTSRLAIYPMHFGTGKSRKRGCTKAVQKLYNKRDTARHSTTQRVTTSAISAARATRPSRRARQARYAT